MPDDKTKTHPQDASRIDLNDPDEVRYWCDKFNCTEGQLAEAVRMVGDSAVHVEAEVQRIKGERTRDFGR